MINGNLEQFLDTGWFSEAEIYYNGNLYWCEGQWDASFTECHFFVDKWRAENEANLYYHTIVDEGGSFPVERVFDETGTDKDLIKEHFLSSPVFDGKTFWQAEKEIAWLDDGGPVKK